MDSQMDNTSEPEKNLEETSIEIVKLHKVPCFSSDSSESSEDKSLLLKERVIASKLSADDFTGLGKNLPKDPLNEKWQYAANVKWNQIDGCYYDCDHQVRKFLFFYPV
jgi:hypothetical protein